MPLVQEVKEAKPLEIPMRSIVSAPMTIASPKQTTAGQISTILNPMFQIGAENLEDAIDTSF